MKKTTIVPAVVLAAALFMVLAPSRTGKTIELRNYSFAPASLAIRPGEAVTFDNRSGITHNVSCIDCSYEAGDVQPGQAKRITFAKAGTYTLFCRYHAARGMGMRLRVGTALPAQTTSPSPTPR